MASLAPSDRFVQNVWYAAMWSADLGKDVLVPRTIVERPLVFFRRANGTTAALGDLCPHRFAPLHRGSLIEGDRLRCGYHGLEFDATGVCSRNPHGLGKIPAGTDIPAYRVVERHSIIWVWMGDRPADTGRIPDFSILDGAPDALVGWRGTLTFDANYQLIADNLLDLSHASVLHEGLLGNAEMLAGEIDVKQDGSTVIVTRYNRDVAVPAMSDLLFRNDGARVDTWDEMRWDPPGCCLLDVGVHPPGATKEDGAGVFAVHLLTPQTRTKTTYLLTSVRRASTEPSAASALTRERLAEFRKLAFEDQDGAMIRAQQQMLIEFPQLTGRPSLFAIDAAPLRARRVVAQLLAAEAETP
jgi:phenylpropionate dioxygenase-like ring-hydroxylating dioxygenase large terminal subunit